MTILMEVGCPNEYIAINYHILKAIWQSSHDDSHYSKCPFDLCSAHAINVNTRIKNKLINSNADKCRFSIKICNVRNDCAFHFKQSNTMNRTQTMSETLNRLFIIYIWNKKKEWRSLVCISGSRQMKIKSIYCALLFLKKKFNNFSAISFQLTIINISSPGVCQTK